MSRSKSYPDPLRVPPLYSGHHTHTLILLHGRGSNSERFGEVFLESTGIARHLPTVKFVFPTAKKRRSTVLKRTPINQWFDNYSLENPNIRTELQVEGLEESCRFLRGLIEEEVEIVKGTDGPNAGDGYERIVIGGLSQGCATSIFCLLGGFPESQRMDFPRLGGFVGMSGWLPFEKDISGLLQFDGEGTEDTLEEEDDPFASDDGNGVDVPPPIQALNHVRDILDMPPIRTSTAEDSESGGGNETSNSLEIPIEHLKIPVFLGHGSAGPKVSVRLGERMASVLSSGFGMDVTWKAYEDFGHWYKVPDEIDDVAQFLQDKVGVLTAHEL